MASNRIGWLLRWVNTGAVACIAVSAIAISTPEAFGDKAASHPLTERLAGAVTAGKLSQSNAATGGATSPFLKAAPELFDATGLAVWDGKRTLQGIWVAHPLATSARRVRIYNNENGLAVDGALFKRDSSLSGASVLISSEAASLLKMDVDNPTKLRIVAVTPSRRDRNQEVATATGSSEGPSSAQKPAEATTLEPPATQPPQPPVTGSSSRETTPATQSVTPEPTKPSAPQPEASATVATTQPAATPAPQPSTPKTQTRQRSSQVAAPQQGATPKPRPSPEVPETNVAAAPSEAPTTARSTAPSDPASDPKTGLLNLSEPNLAATQPDRATTRALSSQAGQVADQSAESRPSIRSQQTTRSTPDTPKEPEKTVVAQAGSPLSRPFVQAGIFSVAQNAQKLISQLKSADIPAIGKPIRFQGKSMTRVLAGPFQTSADRRAAQRYLKRFGIQDAVPVRR